MKKIGFFFFLCFIVHFSHGQACGIYRVKYVGTIQSVNKNIIGVKLPNTMYLHGFENGKEKQHFIETKLTNGKFELEITSHLTTPYEEKEHLISFYKSKSDKLNLIISVVNENIVTDVFIEINWDDITFTVIEDGKFGTLFELKFNDIIFYKIEE